MHMRRAAKAAARHKKYEFMKNTHQLSNHYLQKVVNKINRRKSDKK